GGLPGRLHPGLRAPLRRREVSDPADVRARGRPLAVLRPHRRAATGRTRGRAPRWRLRSRPAARSRAVCAARVPFITRSDISAAVKGDPLPRTKPTITLDEAQQVVAKAIARAQEMGIAIAVVVVDDAGGSVALSRMDGSPVMAVAMATGKAYTAVGMGAPTEVWENLSKDNPSFGGAITSIDGFVPF